MEGIAIGMDISEAGVKVLNFFFFLELYCPAIRGHKVFSNTEVWSTFVCLEIDWELIQILHLLSCKL